MRKAEARGHPGRLLGRCHQENLGLSIENSEDFAVNQYSLWAFYAGIYIFRGEAVDAVRISETTADPELLLNDLQIAKATGPTLVMDTVDLSTDFAVLSEVRTLCVFPPNGYFTNYGPAAKDLFAGSERSIGPPSSNWFHTICRLRVLDNSMRNIISPRQLFAFRESFLDKGKECTICMILLSTSEKPFPNGERVFRGTQSFRRGRLPFYSFGFFPRLLLASYGIPLLRRGKIRGTQKVASVTKSKSCNHKTQKSMEDTTMKSVQEILDIMNHSNSSGAYHRFSPIPGFPVATDGVILLAEAAGCYWLLDVIGSYQANKQLDPAFQVWKLEVDLEASSAVVRGYNDTELIITQEIPFTDFPLEEVKLYLIDGVILLPSEY